MNKPIRKVTIAISLLFLALFVNLNVVQIVQASGYRDNPDNRRVLLNEYSSPRGQIVVSGSNVAESVKQPNDELKYLRKYPEGPVYAPATGYYSFTYGSSAIEQEENSVLSGDSPKLFTTRLANLLTGRDPRGGSVQLTLSKAAQVAAYNAMKASDGSYRRGAVVALEPTTGAILAMVSTPSYDPNELASHNADLISRAYGCYQPLRQPSRGASESAAAFRARQKKSFAEQIAPREKLCKNVKNDPTAEFKAHPFEDSPMLDNALNQLYPPGSIFKIIDAAAALRKGVTPTTQIAAPNGYRVFDPKNTKVCSPKLNEACVENFAGETCQNGKTATLAFALAKSCNTAFAQLAVDKLGARALADQASLFGLDAASFGVPMQVSQSTIGSLTELAADKAALAQTAFGQRDARITPLQAAMLSSAVANFGTLMKPFLVGSELRPNLSVLDSTQPTELNQVLDPTLDAELVTMMEGVVTSPEGTGGLAKITDLGPSVVVGGKTGTADVGETSASALSPDAWFTGFALVKGTPKIAVAVVIENGGVAGDESAGGLAAAPVARKVMEAYLKSIGVN
ncbi:penicillin-binding transpeptidase domain-containing protein [uncultured Jatrophihabitans sp.]|uniref:penicillin-binding transpeptidase domain-containing protein n=1 Tax=uncultured Jatrophihabitans sp. TaxID=1610747 RepID=UPI0035C95571